MSFLGCHLSVSKGYAAMARRAIALDLETFQYFTRNPRGGKARALDDEDLLLYRTLCKEAGFGPLVAHAPYTLNPASPKEHLRSFAKEAIREDLDRLKLLPPTFYNLHPGAHTTLSREEGLRNIVSLFQEILRPDDPMVLFETMAGKGTELGATFEEIHFLLEELSGLPVGVCLDTCHIFDGGYDPKDLDALLHTFDEVIGLSHLKALHLNDSKNPLGSKKDRHANLGEGHIGLSVFSHILHHDALSSLPMVLETPQEKEEDYAKEVALLKELRAHEKRRPE